MSATEIIRHLQNLPLEEQRKVLVYLQQQNSENGAAAPPPATVTEEFKKVADEVFSKNEELFRKLAQ